MRLIAIQLAWASFFLLRDVPMLAVSNRAIPTQPALLLLELAGLALFDDLGHQPTNLVPRRSRVGQVVHLADAIFLEPRIATDDLLEMRMLGMN